MNTSCFRSTKTFRNSSNFISLFLLIISAVILSGCEKKKAPEEDARPIDTAATQDTVVSDTLAADTTLEAVEDSIPDLLGTWTGKFDQRATTLKITKQNEKEFDGVITINYREVINQTVSGSLNTEEMTIAMKDLVHSRFMGKYKGMLSEDGKKFSGTFTMNLDGSKFNFSLTKK